MAARAGQPALSAGGDRSRPGDGRAASTDGVWRWTGPWQVGKPLIDLVEARLRTIPPSARATLELVAAGEPLGLQPLIELAPADGPVEAERRGLLVVESDGRRRQVRLGHPLYGDVLRAGLGQLGGQHVRSRLVEWHGRRGLRRAGDLLRDCTWRLDADIPADAAHFLAGAREALNAADLTLAEELARAAGDNAEARLTLGTVLAYQHRATEAEECLARVTGDAVPDNVRATTASVRARNLHWGLDRPNDADDVLTRALGIVDDPDAKAELALTRGILLISTARNRDTLAAVDGLIGHQQPHVRAGAAVVLASIASFQGELHRTRELVAHSQRSLNDLRLSQPWMDLQLQGAMIGCLVYAGELAEAERRAVEALDVSRKRGPADIAAGWANMVGFMAMNQGRLVTALQHLRLAATAMQDQDVVRWRRAVLGVLARCMANQGHATEAAATLRAADELASTSAQYTEAWVAIARPWVRLATDNMQHARDEALATAETIESLGHYGLLPLILHDAARLGAAAKVADQLAYWASRVEGRLPALRLEHTRALVNPTGAALESVGQGFAELSAELLAAEAFQHAASTYRVEQRLSDALRAEAAAAAALQHCEGARPPVGPRSTSLDALTSREKSVAELAAVGLTSKDIADRLGVSVRTVDNHLARTYAKLGVRGRHDLRGLTPITP